MISGNSVLNVQDINQIDINVSGKERSFESVVKENSWHEKSFSIVLPCTYTGICLAYVLWIGGVFQ